MEIIKTILLFCLCMVLITGIHEFGHLISAKLFNVYCGEFSIGFGPKLFSFKPKETKYTVRLLPLGGYVSMAGDNDDGIEEKVDTTNIPFERTLPGIAKWKRAIVMYAGIFMNFVLAIVIMGLVINHEGTYGISCKPYIVSLLDNYPGQKAGLKENDLIEKVQFDNGSSISPNNYNELTIFLSTYDGVGDWSITVNRDNQEMVFNVSPDYIIEEERYVLGATFESNKYVDTNIFNCFYYACDYLISITKLLFITIINLFRGIGLENLSGPIGIYNTISETNELGLSYYFELVSLLSINVGIVNALPLPIFDGGRAFLLLIEAIIRKPLNKKFENIIMYASLIVLILLMVFTTFKDLNINIWG